jgi:hypothetical protein
MANLDWSIWVTSEQRVSSASAAPFFSPLPRRHLIRMCAQASIAQAVANVSAYARAIPMVALG